MFLKNEYVEIICENNIKLAKQDLLSCLDILICYPKAFLIKVMAIVPEVSDVAPGPLALQFMVLKKSSGLLLSVLFVVLRRALTFEHSNFFS